MKDGKGNDYFPEHRCPKHMSNVILSHPHIKCCVHSEQAKAELVGSDKKNK